MVDSRDPHNLPTGAELTGLPKIAGIISAVLLFLRWGSVLYQIFPTLRKIYTSLSIKVKGWLHDRKVRKLRRNDIKSKPAGSGDNSVSGVGDKLADPKSGGQLPGDNLRRDKPSGDRGTDGDFRDNYNDY